MSRVEFERLVYRTINVLELWGVRSGTVVYTEEGGAELWVSDRERPGLMVEIIIRPSGFCLGARMVTLSYDGGDPLPLPALPEVLGAVIHHGY